jgi:hypothetical protein
MKSIKQNLPINQPEFFITKASGVAGLCNMFLHKVHMAMRRPVCL